MIVLDVEIKKAIRGRNEAPQAGIEYCGGWRDFSGMGIACVCTYDIESHLTRVFLERQLPSLQAYIGEHGNETAGFNTRRFDLPLLATHGINVPQDAKHFDALELIWIALGLDPDRFDPATHGGWSLDDVMKATFGISKSGNGAQAPIWWQTGERGRVIDYCARDVWLEAQLVLHMMAGQPVKNMRGQSITPVRNRYAA